MENMKMNLKEKFNRTNVLCFTVYGCVCVCVFNGRGNFSQTQKNT